MENLAQLVPLVIIAPLIGMLINLFLGKYLGERGVGMVAIGAALIAFVVAVLLLVQQTATGYAPVVVEIPFFSRWIDVPAAALYIGWQFRVDTLSVTMMLVVAGVGSLIHFYATGYMHGDSMYPRFFVYLNMFLVFMMLLVTGNNFLVLFIGWEGVGFCSYILISFWWDRAQKDKQFGTVGWKNSLAGRKAFIVNRVGDFGLLIALFLTFWTFGTLDFYKPGEVPIQSVHEQTRVIEVVRTDETAPAPASPALDEPHPAAMGVFNQAEQMMAEGATVSFGSITMPIQTVLTLIALFMLLGVTGKSAQIPLFVWLPDAMAGPTPVSALIHAATMVTAGVYLIVRSQVFYHYAPFASGVVTLVGAVTALVGGFIALGQWDIKKVLAYSTVSQLGFMVAAAGIGAYTAAMFHLAAHALFKALLFLGSGVVIHAVEHGYHHVQHLKEGEHHAEHGGDAPEDEEEPFDPQDMRNMGGLKASMRRTYWFYLIGALALAGIFPLAGFWSKDEILAEGLMRGFVEGDLVGYIAFGLLFISALLTAFYMGRQVILVFHGQPRTEAARYAGERAYGMRVMVNVLAVLAVGTVVFGFINVASGFWVVDRIIRPHVFADWLQHTVVYAHPANALMGVAILAVAGAVIMILAARSIYLHRPVVEGDKDPLQVNPQTEGLFALANARMFWDEIYDKYIVVPFTRAGHWLADRLDSAFLHDFVHDVLLVKTFNGVARLLGRPVDLGIIDGAVNGLGRLAQAIAGPLGRLQTGYVRVYALSVFIGALLVIVLLLLPLLQVMGGN